ncbi:MAG: gamma carbonic anhydrase family protein [Candidatus Thermoplasmatota archaeon]|nr:gamma carbonic anhydrase family protein [Candidatus Thermoplasmatota archaeon]MBS3790613.1 gamma carbonic anhydrase family protein [Candidatus Thermoplasmatota archaeon]
MSREVFSLSPEADDSCYVAKDSTIIGDVELKEGVSIWPQAVLRGDQNSILVGKGSNIQDLVMIHVDHENKTVIGEDVTIGHGAVIHGCEIGDRTIIGMNASVLSGAKVGKGCIVGANALVPPGKEIPDHSMAVGVPADIVKESDEGLMEKAKENAQHYHELRDEHKAGKYERY